MVNNYVYFTNESWGYQMSGMPCYVHGGFAYNITRPFGYYNITDRNIKIHKIRLTQKHQHGRAYINSIHKSVNGFQPKVLCFGEANFHVYI